MNGKRLLLDTNAVISILRGHEVLLTLAQSAAWVGISIITYLEFKSFPKLTGKDTALVTADKVLTRVGAIAAISFTPAKEAL